MNAKRIAVLYAVAAAALYAVNVPISKLLPEEIGPTMLAAFLYLGERPGLQFYAALLVMIVSTCFMIRDTFELQHAHPHTHTHTHGELVHTHEHTHTHTHTHTHGEDTGNHDYRHRRLSHEHLHAC